MTTNYIELCFEKDTLSKLIIFQSIFIKYAYINIKELPLFRNSNTKFKKRTISILLQFLTAHETFNRNDT